MKIRREYEDWEPTDALDPEPESVLVFLDELAQTSRLPSGLEVVATIDGYGVVEAELPVGERSSLLVQAGDGWDRVWWTAPSGHVHEWEWLPTRTPGELNALLDGRGVERSTMLRGRRLRVALLADDRTLASHGALLSGLLVRLGGSSLQVRDAPAL